MPYVDMSAQLAMPPAPVNTQGPGISLEAMAPPPNSGQVYFPVPGVLPPAYAQNQPVQMMQQPMQSMPPMQPMPGQHGQPMQPMQPNVPVVMPGWKPFRGADLPMSVDPYSVRQQGGQSAVGTS